MPIRRRLQGMARWTEMTRMATAGHAFGFAALLLAIGTATWAVSQHAMAFSSSPPAGASTFAVIPAQLGPSSPPSRLRLRLKNRTAPPKVGKPRLPGAPSIISVPKPAPPRPPCGVRGRPPCTTGPKSAGPTITTPPSRPGCRGERCPRPKRPPVIVTPLPPGDNGPRGGGFDADYFESLPRVAETPRSAAPTTFFPREVVVLLDAGQPTTLEDELASQYRLRRVSSYPLTLIGARAQLYAIPDRRSVAVVVSALAADARVRMAQANFRYARQGDPTEAAQAVPQYALAKISITPAAHGLAQGRGVRIAVIDSQIDAEHPDLAGSIAGRFDAIGGSQRVSDGHGTAVAGIIAARGQFRGVAPMAEILAVRAFAATKARQPVVSSSTILLKAIEWSVTNGAKVLNMSFVGPRDPALQAVIEAAQGRGAVVVAAAGNGGSKAPAAYPAAYPGVIAVTAVNEADERYVHANRGEYITLAAPGVDILAPVDGGRHAFLSGTSFAAPHVSGIVALLLERDASLAPHTALGALSKNAVDLGPAGRDQDFGFGRADALASLQAIAVRDR